MIDATKLSACGAGDSTGLQYCLHPSSPDMWAQSQVDLATWILTVDAHAFWLVIGVVSSVIITAIWLSLGIISLSRHRGAYE